MPLDFLKDGFQVELTFYWSSAVRLSVEFGKVTDFMAGEGARTRLHVEKGENGTKTQTCFHVFPLAHL